MGQERIGEAAGDAAERAQQLDRLEIDDVRAVNLEEELGVQARRQLAEARVEQMAAAPADSK